MCIDFIFGSSPIWAQTAGPRARFKMHRSNMSCQIRFSSCLVVAIFAIIKDSSMFAVPMDIKGLFCLTGVVALGTRKLYTFLIISLLLAHFDIVYLKKSLSQIVLFDIGWAQVSAAGWVLASARGESWNNQVCIYDVTWAKAALCCWVIGNSLDRSWEHGPQSFTSTWTQIEGVIRSPRP